MVVGVLESTALKSILLHADIVECANGVNISLGGQTLELLLSFVKTEDLLDTVEVLSHIVLVLKNSEGSVDLIFVHLFLLIFFIIIVFSFTVFSSMKYQNSQRQQKTLQSQKVQFTLKWIPK